ncbi:hypothetical protein FT663_00961 [Candidozyma haemuli var. vulneris]|uniref:J domain-containing protein n=1 Tax=Candidozyma haemuli TaxID=45357 RepID=A0A2V1AQQ1_9ASCO|nr:hypothetical protein CXQ85_001843 [[Candida] haemuloni]KAF3993137.1 hypothetical protein FT662_00765 [[Candida] haemuloni var. vulneris]KAF3994987.1 hypothetical protein FT663_00961 [[Candida] haemuloni var. vulneris]PVH20064.1 hypothetical protein CXQ85_001843 [[Candida] haemuloni]
MDSEYSYDEGSETWPYFVLALLVFALLPVTVIYLWGATGLGSSTKKRVRGSIEHNHKSLKLEHADAIEKFHSRVRSDRIFNKKLLFLVVGWGLAAFIWVSFAKEVSLQGFFDPHTILDLPYSATDKEIKSKYKKLSLIYHPDKLVKYTETVRKEMEGQFLRMNQAYRALTDEVTMENIKKYGHPDGQQQITHGIAIPKFLVEGKYSPIMIIFYFVLIGVLMPVIVGSWWNNVKTHTKGGLHVDTAALFVRRLADKNPGKVFTAFDILDWVLQSHEISKSYSNLTFEQLKSVVVNHMNREARVSGDLLLEAEKLNLLSQLPTLINGFIEIATVFRAHDVITAAYDLLKGLYQASSPVGKHRELLQLPFIDKQTIESQPIKKLGKLLTLPKEKAGKVLGISDADKLEVALDVAANIPFIRVLDASFRVPGEDIVPPNSTTHVVVYFLIKSQRLKSVPEISEERFLEVEDIEDLKNPLRSNEAQPELPHAYAPYFPSDVANQWDAYIVGQRDNKFVEGTAAAPLERVDLSNLELTQEQWVEGKEDTVILSSFKIRLPVPAPPSKGTYHFRLLLKNNAYFGNDVDIPLEMNVSDPPINVEAVKKAAKAFGGADDDEDDDSDSDISDPEEDSLAGALAALRGEAVKKADGDEEEEDDNESVFTDINTDTEDEGEK